MKILSLSEIIVLGSPCNLTTLSMIALATVGAVNGCFRGMKWPYLVNLSTTTRIALLESDIGNPSMKSIEMSCQAPWGMGNGCKRPAGWESSCLAYWQTRHCCTKLSTSCLKPFQWNSCFSLWYVALTPEWPPIGEECMAAISLDWRAELWAIQTLPWYLMRPWCRLKPLLSGECTPKDVKSCWAAESVA